jgi:hypothetical protein
MSRDVMPLELIAHQGDQRRDDDCEPRAHDRGQLIAKRFARSRRHDRENIFAREHGFENFLLAWPEPGKAENAFQRLSRFVHLPVHGVPVSKVLAIDSPDNGRTGIPPNIPVIEVL